MVLPILCLGSLGYRLTKKVEISEHVVKEIVVPTNPMKMATNNKEVAWSVYFKVFVFLNKFAFKTSY